MFKWRKKNLIFHLKARLLNSWCTFSSRFTLCLQKCNCISLFTYTCSKIACICTSRIAFGKSIFLWEENVHAQQLWDVSFLECHFNLIRSITFTLYKKKCTESSKKLKLIVSTIINLAKVFLIFWYFRPAVTRAFFLQIF